MKIAQILPRLDVGGVERGVIESAIYLKSKNIDNIVISKGGRLVEELIKNGIKHYSVCVDKKSLFSLLKVKKIRKILEDENISILHARSRVPAWIGFFATRNSNINFITTAHGLYSPHFFSKIMSLGKVVIAPSRVIARHMAENLSTPCEKIRIVPRWADLQKFSFRDPHKWEKRGVILSVGRISPTKGYEYLIQAFFKLIRLDPYLKLHIVGDVQKGKEGYKRNLDRLIDKLGLKEKVIFLGFRKDVESVLKESDILVVPSIIEESFGRVAIEAMASGVPVVVTRVGGLKEIVEDKKTGILVEPFDIEALKEGIWQVLSNKDIYIKIAEEARRVVEKNYTLKECMDKEIEIYKEVEDKKRILVIKLSSLGDIILIIPTLKLLKERFPNSYLSILVLEKYTGILHGCPYIDEIIPLQDNYKKLSVLLKLTNFLRRKAFDYIIDLQNNTFSHLVSFLSLPLLSLGYRRKFGFLLNRSLPLNKKDDPLTSQERILSILGVKFYEKRLLFWPIEKKNLPQFSLSLSDKLIGLNISSSSKWRSKNWPQENIREFINLFLKKYPDYKIVLIGDKDSAYLGKILGNKKGVVNLCGRTNLSDLPFLFSLFKAFISPDSANLHLAVSLRIPTIGLFGPTDPSRHTTFNDNLYILYKKISCSFCYNPNCKDNLCMREIKPQEVLNKLEKLIR